MAFGLFGLLWSLWGLWQQELLPQVPGSWLPALLDSVFVKTVLWGLVPCFLFSRGRRLRESWFSSGFPVLPCVGLSCLSLCVLHTLRLVQGLGNTFLEWDWMFLFFSLSAGIVEEIGFRGCCFRYLEEKQGFWPAAILSSVLFTLYHYPDLLFGRSLGSLLSWRTLLLFGMGIVFCRMLHKWKNLMLNMVIHTVWDVLSYLFCLF